MKRVALLFLLVVGACQKSDEFLHHFKPAKPQVFHFTHMLKEMQGESRVDILWVIDNSLSMATFHQETIRNSDLFIREFVKKGGLEWKMGLLSTDIKDQPYLGFRAGEFLDHTTTDPVLMFNAGVRRLGLNGDGNERPFLSVQTALTGYSSFLRKNAVLALNIVTDAPEQSFVTAPEFLNFLGQMKGGTQGIYFYGVLAPKDWGCITGDDPWLFPGSPFDELSKITKGKTYSLCSPDFGKNLSDLGKDLVKRVSSPKIALTLRPKINTISVTWRGQSLPGGPRESGGIWQYDFNLNAILFHDLGFAKDENEEVVVHYEEAGKS